jgi:hypothetical protein
VCGGVSLPELACWDTLGSMKGLTGSINETPLQALAVACGVGAHAWRVLHRQGATGVR